MLARRRAVLPQLPTLSFPFTVAEVIAMGRAPWVGTPLEDDDEIAVAQAMEAVDVIGLGSQSFPTLSVGERALASFARVLAQRCGVLLLDEPTAALDLRHQEQLMSLATACAANGQAVLVVLHDLQLAAAYADEVAVLHVGRLVARGEPAQVFTESLLGSVYGLAIDVVVHPDTGALIVSPRRSARTSTQQKGITR